MKHSFYFFLTFIFQNLIKLIAFLVSFYSPIAGVMLAVGLIILADTLTGLWKSKKLGIKRTSKLMRKGLLPKLLLYQLCIITFFVLDFNIINEFILIFTPIQFFCTKILALGLAYIELLSINENWKAVKGKSITQSIKELISKAKDFKNDYEDLTKDKTDSNNSSPTI